MLRSVVVNGEKKSIVSGSNLLGTNNPTVTMID